MARVEIFLYVQGPMQKPIHFQYSEQGAFKNMGQPILKKRVIIFFNTPGLESQMAKELALFPRTYSHSWVVWTGFSMKRLVGI